MLRKILAKPQYCDGVVELKEPFLTRMQIRIEQTAPLGYAAKKFQF